MAMVAPAKWSHVCVHVRPGLWLRSVAPAIFLLGALLCGSTRAQITLGSAGQTENPASIHGRVLNRVTNEPIGHALVFSPDQRYAMLTDDRGRFEFTFPQPETQAKDGFAATGGANPPSGRQVVRLQNLRPYALYARKQGFLDSSNDPWAGRVTPNQSEVVIYLQRESLIVGHVNLPGAEGETRIQVNLYRRQVREGEGRWELAKTFTTWADGEFRFSELAAGTYKLGTSEELDRDPLTVTPDGQLIGFPPIFYPGATDISTASPIQLAAGATFQASLSPVRHAYYPVKIPVVTGSDGQSMSLHVYPLGHPGPGYSLGYNSAEQLIQGSLPEGSYTLEAISQGRPGSTGLLNFSVRGGTREGPGINLIPKTSVTVTIKEEFKSGQSVFGEVPAAAEDGLPNFVPQRQVSVQVLLLSIEEFGSRETAMSQPMGGTTEHVLIIPNVSPGRYRVRVQSSIGFATSIVSGGTDFLHQPLVVGLGGSIPPRDDGAEVDGKAEEAAPCFVYFLPVGESSGQFRETNCAPDGSFSVAQIPPGAYRVLAFDRQQADLEYNDAEAMRKLESKGEVIHLDSGQKEHLRLKIIQGGEPQ
jgi:hypothetical protein